MKKYVSPDILFAKFQDDCVLNISGGQIGDVFGAEGDGMF